jgi:DNA-binding response OmpR family regulator
MLVDDKPDIRLLLTTRLALEPNLVVVAEGASGADAIARARESRPDAVILDLEMPEMDGFAAIPLLRAVDASMRILVYSGSPTTDDPRLIGPVKPDAIVTKGADLRVLIQRLTALLEQRPEDLLVANIGRLPLEQAVNAFDSWVGLNVRIREAMAAGRSLPTSHELDLNASDLLALIGIFIAMGDKLVRAAHAGAEKVDLRFETRRDVGQAARRALMAIDADSAVSFHKAWQYDMPNQARDALLHLRQRLLAELPVG